MDWKRPGGHLVWQRRESCIDDSYLAPPTLVYRARHYSMLITVFSREMIAAVVEPVGRKANWSANCSVGGGDDLRCDKLRS